MSGFRWLRDQLRSPLARRLVLAIFVFSSLVTLVLTAVQLYGQYRQDVRGIEAELAQLEHVHLNALTESLWATNQKDILLQLDGLTHVPNFEYVAVREGDKLWAQAGQRHSRKVIERAYPMVYRQDAREFSIGTLQVVVGLDAVFRSLLSEMFIILVTNALKTFLVAGFTFIVFHRLVNRHLQSIAAFVRGADVRLPATPLALDHDRPPRTDELDELVAAINALREKTHTALIALQQSEEQIQLATEAADVGLWDWDVNTHAVYYSPVYKRQLGYADDEMPSRPEEWERRLHPDDRDRVLSGLQDYLEGRVGHYEVELRLQHKDGSYRWLLARGALQSDEEGRPVRMSGVHVDITARKEAEQRLRESEERARTVAENSPIGIFMSDADGTIIYGNRAFGAMVDPSVPDRVVGRSWVDFVHAEDGERVTAAWRNFGQGRRHDFDAEFRFVANGTERLVYTRIAAIHEGGRLLGYTGTIQDITERRRAEEQLGRLAHYDSLTGLPNRVLFADRLHQAMIDADRHGRLVGVVFLDLDRFKNINDTLGHDAGDHLLKAVGERLTGAVRKGDTVARLSGDEFTIILADMGHADDAGRVARKILDAFAQPFHLAGRDLYVTASVGITLYPFDVQEVSGLLRNADIAMYRAKEDGRNTYRFYAANMTVAAAENLALENDLRQALSRDELVLHYQPIIDAARGEIVGMEALLRWQHGKRGLIAPAQFIPLAEDTGLIVPIGEWVLHQACAQCRRWQVEFGRPLRIAVNLSARQLTQSQIARTVRQALDASGLDAASLDLEITESILLNEHTDTTEALATLADMGVTLTIDDFGTGYSSLSYLKRFPVDALKIDQSFTRDIPRDADDVALAQAIIGIARILGLKTIAEGVETREQFEFFRAHGCDAAQGYHFSKPVAAAEFATLLAKEPDEGVSALGIVSR